MAAPPASSLRQRGRTLPSPLPLSDKGLTVFADLTDFAARDGKHTVYDGPTGLRSFAIAILLKLPLFLLVLLPLHLFYFLFLKLSGKSKSKTETKQSSSTANSDTHTSSNIATTVTDRVDRPFDVVLYGATGFAGTLAAEYIAKNYGRSIRWAIAGRNSSSLEKTKAALVMINKDLENHVEILIADAADSYSLSKMCASTRVVASSVGPFAKYGSELVKQCILNRCDYVDTTGEDKWVQSMVETHHLAAREAGIRIISFAGQDCIPYDVLVRQTALMIRSNKQSESLVHVDLLDQMPVVPSGGTINTVLYHLEHRGKKSLLGYNPMEMSQDGTRAANGRVSDKITVGPGYSSTFGTWTTFFPLSKVNKSCVKRSSALSGGLYSDEQFFSYKEQLALPNFMAVITWIIDMVFIASLLLNAWLRFMAFQLKMLPRPGEGPSKSEMEKGFLQLTAVGTGSKGAKVAARLYFPRDTGYTDTGRMMVESALCLALEREALPKNMDGVVSPAAALGEVLLKRLVDTGCEYEIKVL